MFRTICHLTHALQQQKIYLHLPIHITQLNCGMLSRLDLTQHRAIVTSQTTAARKPCWTTKNLEYYIFCSFRAGEYPRPAPCNVSTVPSALSFLSHSQVSFVECSGAHIDKTRGNGEQT